MLRARQAVCRTAGAAPPAFRVWVSISVPVPLPPRCPSLPRATDTNALSGRVPPGRALSYIGRRRRLREMARSLSSFWAHHAHLLRPFCITRSPLLSSFLWSLIERGWQCRLQPRTCTPVSVDFGGVICTPAPEPIHGRPQRWADNPSPSQKALRLTLWSRTVTVPRSLLAAISALRESVMVRAGSGPIHGT